METLNKSVQHLYIYTVICFLCQALLMLGGLNRLTLSHWGRAAESSPFPEVFVEVPS